MQTQSPSLARQLLLFSMKAAIAFVLFITAAVVLMPDFTALSHLVKKAAKDEKTRVSLMSFIQNPAALLRASRVDENNGKLDSAIMEMELAIGLLEMHNANPAVIKRYESRLAELNGKLKTPSLSTTPASPCHAGNFQFNGKQVDCWKE